MKTLSRRALLTNAGAALLGASMLAGCVTTKVGTVTTVTINVAKITAYVTAGMNAANTINHVLEKFPGTSQFTVPIDLALRALQVSSDAFDKAVGDQLVVRYDDASIKTIVDSLLNAIQDILGVATDMTRLLFIGGLPIPADWADKLELTRDALATIASVFKALLISALSERFATAEPVAKSPQLAYNEYRALKVLGV